MDHREPTASFSSPLVHGHTGGRGCGQSLAAPSSQSHPVCLPSARSLMQMADELEHQRSVTAVRLGAEVGFLDTQPKKPKDRPTPHPHPHPYRCFSEASEATQPHTHPQAQAQFRYQTLPQSEKHSKIQNQRAKERENKTKPTLKPTSKSKARPKPNLQIFAKPLSMTDEEFMKGSEIFFSPDPLYAGPKSSMSTTTTGLSPFSHGSATPVSPFSLPYPRSPLSVENRSPGSPGFPLSPFSPPPPPPFSPFSPHPLSPLSPHSSHDQPPLPISARSPCWPLSSRSARFPHFPREHRLPRSLSPRSPVSPFSPHPGPVDSDSEPESEPASRFDSSS